MSVAVRLSIVGKTHQRSFRVFAQDKRSKRDGKFLEILGSVNPHLPEGKQVVLKKDRITFWQKQGAQLSPTVAFLVKNGKLPPRPKKEREKKESAPSQPQPQDQQAPQEESNKPEAAEVKTEDQAGATDAITDSKPEEKPQELQEASVESPPTEDNPAPESQAEEAPKTDNAEKTEPKE